MPWIQFENDFQVGDYEFIKIDPRSNPATNLPNPYNQILNCTLLHTQNNPTKFTAIKHKDHSFIWDIPQADYEGIFKTAEFLSATCIDSRDIMGHDYINSETFSLYIQKFDQNPIQYISLANRRRGSTSHNTFNINVYSIKCGEHIPVKHSMAIDRVFFDSIYNLYANQSQGFEKIVGLIEDFNLANTDYRNVHTSSEFLLLCGAIERLIKGSGNAQSFRHNISEALKFVPTQLISSSSKTFPTPTQLPWWKKQINKHSGYRLFQVDAFQNCKTLRDFWAIDFYRTRNKFAHGDKNKTNFIWNAQEHLCIGCLVFLQLLKIYLQKRGLFTLRKFEDNRKLWQIDFLLKRNDLLIEDPTTLTTGWAEARQDAAMNSTSAFPII